ncbi:MAG: hypothetical protein KC996_11205 [Phycisphaerales bacterium]|nr:hypothetical protein [Phycisphaerales bacterium]
MQHHRPTTGFGTRNSATPAIGMAYAGTSLGEDQSASDAKCPGGSIETTGGTRWCCRSYSDAVQCTQLDTPEENQACPISNDGATEWSNSFYTATSTCTSPGCESSTSTDYESYRIETHIRFQCVDGEWTETGRCVSETRRSCVDQGPRVRCESEICGETMQWWVQPRGVSDPETSQSGDACSEADNAFRQTSQLVDLLNPHKGAPVSQRDHSITGESLLPHCQILR